MRGIRLAVALTALPAGACLWDTDTLATEAKGLPGVLEVIVGRFDRNPPEYYEARLARVTRELAESPDQPNLYDDAAVACDRLGRGAEALAWMGRKKPHLLTEDDQYRYHANLGTLLIHDWLRRGGDRAELAQAERAAAAIERAIAINPEAHFGREIYQLQAMLRIIQPPAVTGGLYPTLFAEIDASSDVWRLNAEQAPPGAGRAVEGLCGLAVLGAGWQSVDLYYALEQALRARGDQILAYLAWLRVSELDRAGQRSMVPGMPHGRDWLRRIRPDTIQDARQPGLEASYQQLRQQADRWHAARTEYCLRRLAEGRHPDTDPTFWAGFDDAAYALEAPREVAPLTSRRVARWRRRIQGVQVATVVLAAALVGLLWRRYRRRNARAVKW